MMLIAWDEGGNIVATLDEVRREGAFLDVAAEEAAGIRLRTLWNVNGAVASGTWPESLGAAAHDYRVETSADGSLPRVVRLVHRGSGLVRDRAALEQP